MSIKKIQLDAPERELLRNLLHGLKHEHIEELRNGGYSNTGIPKFCEELFLIGKIIEKLNFEVIK